MEEKTENLVKLAKEGDGESFGKLYELYRLELFRYALYITGNKSDAEDAVQNAVLAAWKNICSLRDVCTFKAWLFKILQNECRHILNHNSKRADIVPIEDCDYLLSSDDIGYSELGADLLKAINSLTPPDGQIILLSVIGGFTSEEIAIVFSMRPATIRSRQSRAIKKLREVLKGCE